MDIEHIKELLTPKYLRSILVQDVEGNLKRRRVRKEYVNPKDDGDKFYVVRHNNEDAIVGKADATVYLNDVQRDTLREAALELRRLANEIEDIVQINEVHDISRDINHDC